MKKLYKNWSTQPRYNITVCAAPAFIWFRNAKVGTRSIKEVLDTHFENREYSDKSLVGLEVKNFYTFGFVRNPYARVVSGYFNKIIKTVENKNANRGKVREVFDLDMPVEVIENPKAGFKLFLEALKAPNSVLFNNNHFRPQHRLIPIDLMDFVGKMEHFNRDTASVFAQLEIQPTLPHKNKSKASKIDLDHFLDPDDRQLIVELYQRDFEIFKYKI